MTIAQSVEHYTQLKLKKRGEGVLPVESGDLSALQDAVTVVGYPIGGDTISVTSGLEVLSYVHGLMPAINSGHSGGPAFNDKGNCVGIAFQSLKHEDVENIGSICTWLSFYVLKPSAIILSFDGVEIADDGTGQTQGNQIVNAVVWGLNVRISCYKGCDASILLDDTATFTGEKNALPKQNSAIGYDVIDTIKSQVEASCNGTHVSTIVGLSLQLRRRSWNVPLGRRDAKTASQSAADSQIPSPFATLISMFAAKGLNAQDMTVLSGAHSIGQAQCFTFRTRIYNETNIDPRFATTRRANCPATGGNTNLAPLDIQTVNQFDNNYFQNLVAWRRLLHSDQVLFNNGSQDALVQTYSLNNGHFVADFAAAMVKMGNISPLTGTEGEIRKNCRKIN
ncbi:hypothetical protein HHK36_015163 [Tetracentron sinense]|uniref:Peroxidase n=1 Tax=Tetracentron sinense TaxID=13715 RepID=A0A835DDD9_TETSI|nr:hypothetical protein HHK36_015163 [Tetracentron sinense]